MTPEDKIPLELGRALSCFRHLGQSRWSWGGLCLASGTWDNPVGVGEGSVLLQAPGENPGGGSKCSLEGACICARAEGPTPGSDWVGVIGRFALAHEPQFPVRSKNNNCECDRLRCRQWSSFL
eukprot:TRINITY_DN83943_c0_g1_i2.p2 TRINITY_DN83943_c0_g1~~TRINITY_DN83943_c0_g1_i2.p2  ORF type:complete len:123 (-),score=12.00 TRINITY_DN83943_c0_g1_i2:1084-1452(-)